MTYRDWLAFPDDHQIREILEGEVFVSPPPSICHQSAVLAIASQLREHLRRTGAGRVFLAPTGVRLAESTVPEPDVLVVLRENADRIGEQFIDGPPDLVVEVLSPGTAQRDVGRKRDLYEAHGVREYWIVDTEARTVEVLQLRAGRYERAALHGAGDRLRSPLLGEFEMDVADAFGE